MQTSPLTHVVITGATGLIGRWLLIELTRAGVECTALIRAPEGRLEPLRAWVAARGGDPEKLSAAPLDLDAEDLGLDSAGEAALTRAQAVFHLAARFGFGLTREAAHRANVQAALRLVRRLEGSQALMRLVHISGYRAAGRAALALDVDDGAQLAAYYREHGAYEASKMEAHARVPAAARAARIPCTVVSPAMVIGDSRTGETTQLTGLAQTLEQLWQGRLPALAGSDDTWIPVVPVDVLARLLAALPGDPTSESEHLVVFDDRTPTLPELVGLAAARMGVSAPRLIVPTGWLRRTPTSLSGVDPEALSFLSADRYDPAPLQRTLTSLGIEMPPVRVSLERWIDHLLDTRFGARAPRGGRNLTVAGRRVFARGERSRSQATLLHGVMLNEQSWSPVIDRLDAPALAPDLPGLGRSAAGGGTPGEWTQALLASAAAPTVLVGHSLGCAYAVEYAAAHPERVHALVLVAPFFLQRRPGWPLRQPGLMTRVFRHSRPERLAAVLDGPLDEARADAVELLRRPSVARRNARALAWAARRGVRERLVAQLEAIAGTVPVTLVVGDEDPLLVSPPASATVVRIEQAGHYPQLTHPEQVAGVITEALAATASSPAVGQPSAEAPPRAPKPKKSRQHM